MPEVTIKVDGKTINAKTGEMLLPVLLAAGFDIPHMCYNEEIKPFGACRLCLIEVEVGGRRNVVSSCSYPVTENMEIFTDTESIKKHRRMVAELLLARCPEVEQIQKLAAALGVVSGSRFAKKDEGCILCGLCTRACEQVVGASAISFVGRGPEKEVGTPFLDKSEDCIGCGSCAYICPTQYIEVKEDGDFREFPLWKVKFEFAKCKKCGQNVAPKKQIEFMMKKASIPEGWFDYCQDCREAK